MDLKVMSHHEHGASHEDVEVRVRLDYVEAGGMLPFFKVSPFQLDVAFPAGGLGVVAGVFMPSGGGGGGVIGAGHDMDTGAEGHEMHRPEPVDPGHELDMEGEGHDMHEAHQEAEEHTGPRNDP